MDLDSHLSRNVFKTFILSLCLGSHHRDVSIVLVIVLMLLVLMLLLGFVLGLCSVVFMVAFGFKSYY